MYFTVQSCLSIVINFLRPPEPNQNMPYLSTCHWLALHSATLTESVEILQKWAKFHGLQKTVVHTEKQQVQNNWPVRNYVTFRKSGQILWLS